MLQLANRPKNVLRGEFIPPADKSITHRAILLSALAQGSWIVRNPLRSEDTEASLQAVRKLGVAVEDGKDDCLILQGKAEQFFKGGFALDFDCANSGTTMRLLSGLLSLRKGLSRVYGDASLNRRDMGRVLEPLAFMGSRVAYEANSGRAPFVIYGGVNLRGGKFQLPVASAQVASALCIAGLFAGDNLQIKLPSLVRNHTTLFLQSLGVKVSESSQTEGLEIFLEPYLRPFDDHEVEVPGDLSSVAFFLCFASILAGSQLQVKGVGLNQGRGLVLSALEEMGAKLELSKPRQFNLEPVVDINVSYSCDLKAVTISKEQCASGIDELPCLAFIMACAEGTSYVYGAGELTKKESNRLKLLEANLGLLGIKLKVDFESGDYSIEGKGSAADFVAQARLSLARAQEPLFLTGGDHRLAMIGLLLQLLLPELKIEETDSISVSFPNFLELLESLRQ
jgi:3-phosphoshikimate 1-carboxyvinyltransferase